MVYIPNIPQAGNTLAESQPWILANFTDLNTYFSVDHVALDAAANNGSHNKVGFIGVNPSAPVPVTTEGITLIADYSAATSKYILRYKQNSVAFPADSSHALTNSHIPLAASIGYSYLPGGILIQWGRTAADVVTGVQTTINFPVAFTSTAYSVQVTLEKDNPASGTAQAANVVRTTVSTTGFDVYHSASGNHKVQWMAIGVSA